MAGAAGRRNILQELTSVSANGFGNFQSSSVALTPSPDEAVIQQRGRQRKSATYNYDAPDPVFFKTPTKSPKKTPVNQRICTPTKSSPVRSSPRRRLILTPEKNIDVDITKLNIHKRVKRGRLLHLSSPIHLDSTIKALSHVQLVDLISRAVKQIPDMKQVFESMIPTPDLVSVEEKLSMLQRNVYKSIPRNIWGSQDGTFCFLRVRTQLEMFKKECIEHLHRFIESQHWSTVFDYIFIALKLSVGLPNWTNVAHNKIKNSCIKQLTASFISSLKKANLDNAALSELVERLSEFDECPEVKICIKAVEEMKVSS